MLPQIIVVLAAAELTNAVLQKIVLPWKGAMGEDAERISKVELAVTPRELEQILNSNVGGMVRTANNRAMMLEKINV